MKKTIYEIAEEIGTSKQNVNQMLKRGMRKIYNNTKNLLGKDHSPFETIVCLSQILGIKNQKDFSHFFFDFPEDVRSEVIESAAKLIRLPEGWKLDDFLQKDINNKRKSPNEKIVKSIVKKPIDKKPNKKVRILKF